MKVLPWVCQEDRNLLARSILRHMGHCSSKATQALEQGSLKVPLRTVCKKGLVTWRVANMYRDDWTDKPPLDLRRQNIPLQVIACPRCGEHRGVRGCTRSQKGDWNYLKCMKCQNKNSAQHWLCECRKLWHACDVHVLIKSSEISKDTTKAVKHKRNISDKNGSSRPAPGPEPKRVKVQEYKEETAQGCTTWTSPSYRLDPDSVLGQRSPWLARGP